MIEERHILLISDDQQKASELHNVLVHYHPEIVMSIVEKFQQSDVSFSKQLPQLIILLFTASVNSHYTWLKKIRQTKKLNEIPVFVYSKLPEKQELQELLKEMQTEG